MVERAVRWAWIATARKARTALLCKKVSELMGKKKWLEMWANAQCDGRPAECRWRPLFNPAKFTYISTKNCVECTELQLFIAFYMSSVPVFVLMVEDNICLPQVYNFVTLFVSIYYHNSILHSEKCPAVLSSCLVAITSSVDACCFLFN